MYSINTYKVKETNCSRHNSTAINIDFIGDTWRLKDNFRLDGFVLATLPCGKTVEVMEERGSFFCFKDDAIAADNKIKSGKVGIMIQAGNEFVQKLDYKGMVDSIDDARVFYDWDNHRHSYDCATVHRKIPRVHALINVITVNGKITPVTVTPATISL
jgi:hypothetical protein